MTVTILDAYKSLGERKKAGGIAPGSLSSRESLIYGVSGLDLTVDELDQFATNYAHATLPILAHVLGPLSGIATTVGDGILIGLELAKLRAKEADVAGTNRNLRRRLLELAESVLELDDASQTGDVPLVAGKMRELVTEAESVLETVR